MKTKYLSDVNTDSLKDAIERGLYGDNPKQVARGNALRTYIEDDVIIDNFVPEYAGDSDYRINLRKEKVKKSGPFYISESSVGISFNALKGEEMPNGLFDAIAHSIEVATWVLITNDMTEEEVLNEVIDKKSKE